jgi:hypothetical protein
MAYTRAALDAVGLGNGPSHNEIIMTEEGPALVEINARFCGSSAPLLNRECLGRGQLEVMMDVLLAPERFLTYWDQPYQVQKHGLAVYLISRSEDSTLDPEMLERIKARPSCHRLSLMGPLGARLSKTVDMFTMPGMVELVHADPQQIQVDYAFIRDLESSNHLYRSSQ